MVEGLIFTTSDPPLYVVFGICVGITSLYAVATRNAELPRWPMTLLYIAGGITLVQMVVHITYGIFRSVPKVTETYATIQSLLHIAALFFLLVIFSAISYFLAYRKPDVNPVVLESSSLE